MSNEKLTVVTELHKPARKNYPRRRVHMRGIDETWQADLVEMLPYARENNGYKYLLTVIDIFSKYAWAVPVKSKSGPDVTAAMQSVLVQGRIPKNLHTDEGKEFYNAHFKNLMQRFDINHYSTHSNLKASICERFNRTLKNKMWPQFNLRGNYKWIDILPNLISKYNETKHRTIGMKPKDVTAEDEEELMERFKKQRKIPSRKPKLKVGDRVRVSKHKHVFEKGYTPNWTTEIFTVDQVMSTNPVTYKLKDYQNQPIAGGFYEQELLKVRHSDIYLVEKVIKKRGDKVFVKWLGFDSSHNSWIDKSDM